MSDATTFVSSLPSEIIPLSKIIASYTFDTRIQPYWQFEKEGFLWYALRRQCFTPGSVDYRRFDFTLVTFDNSWWYIRYGVPDTAIIFMLPMYYN